LICLCLGVGLTFLFTQNPQLFQRGSQDPAAMEEAARSISDYTLPAGYTITQSSSILGLTSVSLISSDGKMNITLSQFPENAAYSREQMEQQINTITAQQTGLSGKLEKISEEPITLRGTETTRSLYEGKLNNGAILRQVVIPFEGKNGPALLLARANQDDWDEAGLSELIRSMH